MTERESGELMEWWIKGFPIKTHTYTVFVHLELQLSDTWKS